MRILNGFSVSFTPILFSAVTVKSPESVADSVNTAFQLLMSVLSVNDAYSLKAVSAGIDETVFPMAVSQ